MALAAILALVLTLASACIAADTAKLPVWKPLPAEVGNLAAPASILTYTVRPPAGYTLLQRNLGTFRAWAWKGVPHPDGSAPVFVVLVGTMPASLGPAPDPSDRNALAQFFHMNMLTLQRTRQNWFNTAPQYGTVNGHVFARCYWKGVYTNDKGAQLSNHGFDYVAIDGRKIITVRAEDIEPYNTEDLAVAEAAAMTFSISGDH
jgi:hypothetical protein